MSFIDDSEQNMEKYVSSLKEENKSVPLLKEQTGGSVAGFVGGAGMGIDALFAGPFHPDSGHGSKNKQLLQKQLKDREKLDKLSTDDEYAGENPVGGYYEVDVDAVTLAYDELEQYNQASMDYNTENTPLADIEWKSSGWDYEYDEDELYIEEEDFVNTSETNMEYVNTNLKYDEFDASMGRDTRNKMFQKIEKIINKEEIKIDNESFLEKSKTNFDKVIDEETSIENTGISLKTIYKNDISLSIHIGG